MERLRRLLDRNGMLCDGSLKEFMMYSYWVWTSPPPTYLHNDESSLHEIHLIELAIGCLTHHDNITTLLFVAADSSPQRNKKLMTC
jgi:hypothetical protein